MEPISDPHSHSSHCYLTRSSQIGIIEEYLSETLNPVLDHTVSPFARNTSHLSIDPERTAANCHSRALGQKSILI
ncbi:hypothetical protein Y032_0073g751 [Ancylostoma ceylanicum]|uniref:Uncharacterized protein n=1 Tax=Ancylostoma ceylanicum TaxID=53326 RepID=A0A016TW59_9BILA|nr:hypothetical protein Y032_0073g751 [Ancylostoma ceylanicum]